VDAPPAELVDDPVELLRETRLPDPGRPENGDEVWDPLACDALPDPPQHFELTAPPDEPARKPALARRVQRPDRDPRWDRQRLPLRLHGLGRLVLDRVLRGRVGLAADDDPVHRRGRLQA
jgi:hypothetical protein